MKHILFVIVFSLAAVAAFAQDIPQQNRQARQVLQPVQDSVFVQRPPLADSTLVGKTIFQYMAENAPEVELSQPAEMEKAYRKYVRANGEKKRNGYRIRLFFDNKQTARMESEELEKAFQEQFPLIPTYRSYTNPFFKVVVGDYRTKSDAIRELNKILPFYPQAIVVKESIFFPAI